MANSEQLGKSSLVDLIESLPDLGATWGPPVTTETTLNGVPYAPYSKGDKLGRMADWTTDSKDGRDGRGGRQQYNRNYRGKLGSAMRMRASRLRLGAVLSGHDVLIDFCWLQISRCMAQVLLHSSPLLSPRMSRRSPSFPT